MRFYLLSPAGVPPNPHLFPMFLDTWRSKGIEIVDRIQDCDVVLFDLHSRIAPYHQGDIDYIMHYNVKVATFDEWDRGNMSTDQWPNPLTEQQELVMPMADVHFSRLLDKTKKYPATILPYEKPILYSEPLLTPEELFNRPYDIAFIANHSPSRERIAKALEGDSRLNCIIKIGQTKIPFENFLNIHKQAKLFVSSGAGGYTDERKQLLFSVAGLIQEETDQLLLCPFSDLLTCIKISSTPSKYELDRITETVRHKDLIYGLYERNYEFMKKYYSAEYIATDILNKILAHA